MTTNELPREVRQLLVEAEPVPMVDQTALIADFRNEAAARTSLGLQILSICGAYLASAFLLGFVFTLGVYDSPLGFTVTGLLLLVGGYLLERLRGGVAGAAFNVSLTVNGFALLFFGLSEYIDSVSEAACLVGSTAAVLLALHTNRVIVFLATVTVAASVHTLAYEALGHYGVHLTVGLFTGLLLAWSAGEARLIAGSRWANRRYDAIRTGLIFGLLVGAYYLSDYRWWVDERPTHNWLASLALIPAVGWVAHTELRRFGADPARRRAYLLGVGALLLPTFFAPALSAPLFVLLVSWRNGHRTGTVVGVIALAYALGRYYYDLNLTLLHKSYVLVATGLLFLGAYALLRSKLSADEAG